MGYPLKVDHIDVLQLPQECDLPVEKSVQLLVLLIYPPAG